VPDQQADDERRERAKVLAEQRYRAVLEVRDGQPVGEVAVRYGVTRQTITAWRKRYERLGLDGLKEFSRRPHHSPRRVAADVEALICELRRTHRRWGARRISYELSRRDVQPAPSHATVHRVLVRNGLVREQEQQRKRKYKRWQREAPMHLWQLDLMGGVFLTDGRECKMLTAIDDHSRFVVTATVLERPTGKAVCDAFTAAMRRHGVPFEVLTDNGKQFTGRFTRPIPAEVLFERTCRDHGITQRLTKRRSPTTTGKIERWHQTLRRELLDEAGAFATIEAAQAAIDSWTRTYNHDRPHQSLGMATPASLFRPATAPTTTSAPTPPATTPQVAPATEQHVAPHSVSRLKSIKRSMYGRAKFDLLRKKVLCRV
jgi:transposase InsO family protein